jgi:uncharacterized membrane protein YcaP (DUF421 family)
VVLLRLSGKRTVAKWNAFDLIVTVALGSALATPILSGDVSLIKGVAAFAALIGAQFTITWLSVRVPLVRQAIKSRPALLVRNGDFQREMLRRQRVTEDEVRTAIRRRGFGDVREVRAVVLETDGSFSVIGSLTDEIEYSTLRGVDGLEEPLNETRSG